MITFPIWFEDRCWNLPKEFTPWAKGNEAGILGFHGDNIKPEGVLYRLGLKKGVRYATVSIVDKPTRGYKRCMFYLEDIDGGLRYKLIGSNWTFCREGIEKYFVPFGRKKYQGWVKVK